MFLNASEGQHLVDNLGNIPAPEGTKAINWQAVLLILQQIVQVVLPLFIKK